MKKFSPILYLLCLSLVWACTPTDSSYTVVKASLSGDTMTEDEKAVHAAAMDYLDGLYKADTTFIERSIHPELRKRGYWFNKKKESYSGASDMTYEQLIKLTKRWNKDGSRANENSVKEVTVFEVLDKTATAKVTAVWGVDYMHLVKLGDEWKVMNILWQSPPPNS